MKFLFFLLGSAFLLRVFLAVFLLGPEFPVHDDLMRYQDWGSIAYHHGVSDTYRTDHISFGSLPNNQPPGTVYVDLGIYTLSQFISGLLNQDFSNVYPFLLKSVTILADLGIGALIYYCVAKNAKRKYALIAAAFFLFNPVVIYNSTVWGQIDALNNLLFFGSLMFLFGNKYFLSVLFFFFSLYIKISLLPLLPFLFVILLVKMQFQWIKLLAYIITSVVIVFCMTFPVSNNPMVWWLQFFLTNASGELPYITNYAFNFWSIVFNPDSFSLVPVRSSIYWGLSLEIWGYLIFCLFCLPLLFLFFTKKYIDDAHILGILSLIAFAVFLFFPGMHQRYLYPVLPLLAAYIGIKHKGYGVYLLASFVNFVNLYVVWHPAVFLPEWFTTIIAHSKVRLSMSILIVLAFFVMYLQLLFKDRIKLLRFLK